MPKFWKPKAYKPQVIRIVFIYSYHYNFTHFIWSIIQLQTLVEDGMLVLLVVLQGTHLNHSFYIVVAILSCCELLPCCVACVLVRYYFHHHCLASGTLMVSHVDVHILVPCTHNCHFPFVASVVVAPPHS
jgi:hypothetical protein